MSTTKYIGYEALASYISEQKTWSYKRFLNCHRDIIIASLIASSPISIEWSILDKTWCRRFLEEAKSFDSTFLVELKKKVKAERNNKGLREYWKGVIKECGKNFLKRNRDINEDEDKENFEPRKRFQTTITLICLVQGDTSTDAFDIDISSIKSVSHLKKVIKLEMQNNFARVDANKLKLWKVEIPCDNNDQLRNLLLQDKDELLATNKISKYFPVTPSENHINVIIKLPFLSLEEALSCIPPSVEYPPDTSTSKGTKNVSGVWPTRIRHWDGFFDEVTRYRFDQQSRFEKPQFINSLEIVVETNVGTAMEINIFRVLNTLIGPDYKFSTQKPAYFNSDDPNIGNFIPDYTCRMMASGEMIVVLEIKRSIVLEALTNDHELLLKNGNVKNAIKQIYNYMASLHLQYGILSTYDNHWFMYRPKDNTSELQISHCLPLQSTSPPVLKAYAYLAHLAKNEPKSLHPNIISRMVSQESQQSRQNPQQSNTGRGARINSRQNLSSGSLSSSTLRISRVEDQESQPNTGRDARINSRYNLRQNPSSGSSNLSSSTREHKIKYGIVTDAEKWYFMECSLDEEGKPSFKLSKPLTVSYEDVDMKIKAEKILGHIIWLQDGDQSRKPRSSSDLAEKSKE